MCYFHNFGLILRCLKFFRTEGAPKGTRSVEKISNNVDFSLWGNRATTLEYFLTFSSETKIMKIIHSVLLTKTFHYCYNFGWARAQCPPTTWSLLRGSWRRGEVEAGGEGGKRQSILDKHQTFDFKAMEMANLSPSLLHSTKTQWSKKIEKCYFGIWYLG